MTTSSQTNKCPHCANPLNSFITHCEACGYELRNSRTTTALTDLIMQLKKIDEHQYKKSENTSLLKSLIGKDFNTDDSTAEWQLEEWKEEQKENLIKSFPIPNTKEDIMEFMILTATHINKDTLKNPNQLTKAWLTKLEQVYTKSKILLNETDFQVVDALYKNKLRHIEDAQFKNFLSFIIPTAVVVYSLIIMWLFTL